MMLLGNTRCLSDPRARNPLWHDCRAESTNLRCKKRGLNMAKLAKKSASKKTASKKRATKKAGAKKRR